MNRPLRLVLPLLALAAALSCVTSPWSERRLLLWEIERADGLGGVLALTGSIHLGPEEGLDVPPEIQAAYAAADGVVVEVDAAEADQAELMALMLSMGRLPPGESLRDRISEETFAALEEELESLGLPIAGMTLFEPWLVALTLEGARFQQAGFDGSRGLDRSFIDQARADGKEVVALETPELQFGLFDGLAPEQQELLLKDAISEPHDFERRIEEILEAWERGDDARLERLIVGEGEVDPATAPLQRALYDDRNATMSTSLEGLLGVEGRRWFAVVGAGHVLGETGIPTLLRERGYRVRRVEPAP